WVLWRAKNAILGQAPRVFPWHPAWVDFRAVLQELDPFFNDPRKKLLMVSNAPTPFNIALADGNQRVRRLRGMAFLQQPPQRYRALESSFDICLIELTEDDLIFGAALIDRIVPLMKPDASIIVTLANNRVNREA